MTSGLSSRIWAMLSLFSSLINDLARAVYAGDWPAARGIGEYLSVDVSIA